MPRWWPQGYLYLLSLPGLGYFRVPARYTLLTCLGLAVLAGEGFDRSISPARFRLGLAAAILFGGCATVGAVSWSMRPDVNLPIDVRRGRRRLPLGGPGLVGRPGHRAGLAGEPARFVGSAGRRRHRAGDPLLRGDDPVGLVDRDTRGRVPVLDELARKPSVGLIGGELENLPVRAGSPRRSPTWASHTPIRTRSSCWCRSGSFDRASPSRRTRRTRPRSSDGSGAVGSRTWSPIEGPPNRVGRGAGTPSRPGARSDHLSSRGRRRRPGPGRSSSWTSHSPRRASPSVRGRSPTDGYSSTGCHGRMSGTSPGSWRKTWSPIVPMRGPPGWSRGTARPQPSSTTVPATWSSPGASTPAGKPGSTRGHRGRSCRSTADSRPSAWMARASIA